MRTRRVWIGLAVWTVLAPACAGATIEADSTISAVTVFADRAGVTRTATLKLSTGTHTIRFSPLPSTVDPNSVSAKGEGQASVILYGVQVVTSQLEAAQDPRVEAIEEQIRELTFWQRRLHNTKYVLEQEREYLASIQAASVEQIGKDLITRSPSAADAESLLGFIDTSLLENFERDQKADVKLEELARELDKLQRELGELTRGRARQETAILVDLEARDGGGFQLEVSYRVPGASWQPSYVARADTGGKEVELVSFGVVRQRTGEDWDDVALTLSTARPAVAGTMPELHPWFLRPWEPARPVKAARSRQALMSRAEAPAADELMELDTRADFQEESLQQKAQLAYAAVSTQGPAVTFQLPKPASVASDWQPQKVPIGVARLAAALAYEATPRLVPYAFLRAKVTNTTGSLYLPGSVSVFLDGAFVATAALKQVAPEEEFDLYLGIDERVKIKRKRLKKHTEISLLPGLRGRMKSTQYEYLTTIENYTGRGITIATFDQYPVSEREEITVESIRMTPKAIEKDPEKPGVFSWTVELLPSQKQELRLVYRVRHPVDMQIQ